MKKIIEFLSALLFPVRCIGCDADGEWLCATCRQRLQCKRFKCSYLRAARSQAAVPLLVAASYHQPLLQQLLQVFKYRFVADVADILGGLLVSYLKTADRGLNFDLIIPVPLASRRLRWRSFNQSALLAQRVSQSFGWPINGATLVRQRYSRPQVGLDARHRVRNVRQAFGVNNAAAVRGKRVLLLDDVVTTGSTLAECATALRAAGVREVWALVIARG